MRLAYVSRNLQAGINFATTAAFADDLLDLAITGLAYPHAQAIVGENFEFLDVVVGLTCHD